MAIGRLAKRGAVYPYISLLDFTSGSIGGGISKRCEQICVPLQRMDIEKHGAACIAGVGNEGAPLR